MKKIITIILVSLALFCGCAQAYVLQTGAPQIVYQGRTFAAGAILLDGIVTQYSFAVFELKPDGWNEIGRWVYQISPGQLLPAIQAKGGIANFSAFLVQGFADSFAAILASAPPSAPTTGEPTTDAQAFSMLQTILNSYHLAVINGQIVLTK